MGWPVAILFDFDGVLVDSEPVHFMAFQNVLATEGIVISREEYYQELLGFDDRGAFRHIYAQRGLPLDAATFGQLMSRKSDAMMEAIDGGGWRPLPGAAEVVRALAKRYPLAICSGALGAEIRAMLNGMELAAHFRVIVAAEDVTNGKPDPEGYLLTMQRLGLEQGRKLSPADCLVIEDSPSVIASITQAGFPTVGVATSHPIEHLSAADWTIPTLSLSLLHEEIPQLLSESP